MQTGSSSNKIPLPCPFVLCTDILFSLSQGLKMNNLETSFIARGRMKAKGYSLVLGSSSQKVTGSHDCDSRRKRS